MAYKIIAASGPFDEPADTLICQRDDKFFLRNTVHQEHEIDSMDLPLDEFIAYLVAKWGYFPVVGEDGKPNPKVEDDEFGALGFNDNGFYELAGVVPYDTDGLLPSPQTVRAT